MKKIITMLMILVSSTVVFSQSLLWKISGGDIKESYVFGTIHLSEIRTQHLHPIIYNAVDNAKVVTGELDVLNPDMSEIMKIMFLPDNKRLKDCYEDSLQYLFVDSVLKEKLGASYVMANRMRPMIISTLLEMTKEGYNQEGLDMKIQQYALQSEKTFVALETEAEQVKAFDAISAETSANDLYEQLKHPEIDGIKQLFDYYVQQDLEKIDSMMRAELDSISVQKMLTERNVKLAQRLLAISQKNKSFHTFGAGHLGGPKGVLAIIRKKGYKVEPVLFEFGK